jgi:hypothetical protein
VLSGWSRQYDHQKRVTVDYFAKIGQSIHEVSVCASHLLLGLVDVFGLEASCHIYEDFEARLDGTQDLDGCGMKILPRDVHRDILVRSRKAKLR